MPRKKVIIMGAAGRDFHNFNTYFRDNESYEVIGFTATQIPFIEQRHFPAVIAGKLYPEGIPIYSEDKLPDLINEHKIEEVVFSYSDVPYDYVMSKAAVVNSLGADFKLLGLKDTTIKSKKRVISICAVRTGCGKSQTTRKVCQILKKKGLKPVAIRHPMPYGDLSKQIVQRFATYEDLEKHNCTIEEREEYEAYVDLGLVIYAGVDYGEILKEAEKEADVILWDGGNNDLPFYKPDLHITVADPHRPGDELFYYPGESNIRISDVVVINKIDTADYEDIDEVRRNIRELNPQAIIIDAASPIFSDEIEKIKGKKVLVIEDGPTLTHGEMDYGAGFIAAEKFGAAEIIDPTPYAVGSITDILEKFGGECPILPAMGYSDEQIREFEETINRTECDVVLTGTPINLKRVLKANKPIVHITYELQEIGKPTLEEVLNQYGF